MYTTVHIYYSIYVATYKLSGLIYVCMYVFHQTYELRT